MDCDLTSVAVHLGARAERGPDCLLPGLLPGLLVPREAARSQRCSEASPAGGGALGAAVSSLECLSRSHRLCFPGPACSRQPGTAGCTCRRAGELCGEKSPCCGCGVVDGAHGAERVSFLRDLGISSSPLLPSAGQRVTVASPFCSAQQPLAAPVPSTGSSSSSSGSPQHIIYQNHGHGDRVELPHLP